MNFRNVRVVTKNIFYVIEFTEDSYAQKESVYTPDKELLEIYFKSQKFLKDYEESYRDFLQLSNLKTFRFNCQKAINIPVNTISGISEGHLRDKYDKLHSLLMGKSDFSAGNYSDAVKFCKDHLAKKLIVCIYNKFLEIY